jgi:hypothetical protein
MGILARLAKNSTASPKVIPSFRIMKAKTLPPAPQPKQWNICRAGLTEKEGVFSEWKGHKPK